MPNKPYTRTSEHNRRISEAKKGHSVSEETRQKLREHFQRVDPERVVVLYSSGIEQREIAESLGVSKSTVSKIIRSRFTSAEILTRRRQIMSAKMRGNLSGLGRVKSEAELKALRDRWGDKNPNWKGERAKRYSGHARAQRKYNLAGRTCERCDAPAEIRHHRDENPHNNPEDGSNIEYLCRPCHMKLHKVHRKRKVKGTRRNEC